MLMIANDDQPGVIGEVGTILGRHGVNIANFALGRGDNGAIGVVNVDEDAGDAATRSIAAVDELRRVPAIRDGVDRAARLKPSTYIRCSTAASEALASLAESDLTRSAKLQPSVTHRDPQRPRMHPRVSRVPPTTGSPST